MKSIKNKIIKNICIIGAGNVGHYLMALLGANEDITINVLTSNAENFHSHIESLNTHSGEITVGRINKVSINPKDVISSSDMILFTVPRNVCSYYLEKIYDYTPAGTFLGFIPGSGGVEFLAQKFVLNKNCIVFGSQRVPSGTKVVERGRLVNSLGNRKDIRIAALNPIYTEPICNFFEKTMGIKTIKLPNYLSVTFVPSNQILHTSRLYGLFHNFKEGDEWDSCLSFYRKWDDFTSEILLSCDDELQQCCNSLDKLDLKGVLSLKEHYEIKDVKGKNDIERMTKKICSLDYLKDNAPMVKNENGKYVPDFNSRYFQEDFPYGLCVLRSFINVCIGKSIAMDSILKWYSKVMKKEYYVNDIFCGKDLRNLPLLENYGIHSVSEIYEYYDNLSRNQ